MKHFHILFIVNTKYWFRGHAVVLSDHNTNLRISIGFLIQHYLIFKQAIPILKRKLSFKYSSRIFCNLLNQTYKLI